MGALEKRLRRSLVPVFAILGMTTVVVSVSWFLSGLITSPDCPLPTPPIPLLTHRGSGELVFVAADSSVGGDLRVSNLTYEFASYPPGTDTLGPGIVNRSGPLGDLNTTGWLQFHDMEAEGELSPRNDFFILWDPPSIIVQLRILRAGTPIAWNMIVGCG